MNLQITILFLSTATTLHIGNSLVAVAIETEPTAEQFRRDKSNLSTTKGHTEYSLPNRVLRCSRTPSKPRDASGIIYFAGWL